MSSSSPCQHGNIIAKVLSITSAVCCVCAQTNVLQSRVQRFPQWTCTAPDVYLRVYSLQLFVLLLQQRCHVVQLPQLRAVPPPLASLAPLQLQCSCLILRISKATSCTTTLCEVGWCKGRAAGVCSRKTEPSRKAGPHHASHLDALGLAGHLRCACDVLRLGDGGVGPPPPRPHQVHGQRHEAHPRKHQEQQPACRSRALHLSGRHWTIVTSHGTSVRPSDSAPP
jgi:hypothetical protein